MAKDKNDLEPSKLMKREESEGLQALKEKAKLFKNHLNAQYRDAIAYNPDTATIAKVSVSKWLEVSEAFAEAVELPGLPFGNITHVYGKPNTGKTTFLMDAVSACQRKGILPILILTEHKFDFNRLSKFMNADPEAMVVLHADNIEQAYGFMEKILRDLATGKLVLETEEGEVTVDMTNQDCFIMMDSIGNTMSESEMEYEIQDWDKSMGKAAKALKNLTKRINHLVSKVRDKCGILLLNQSYQSMPAYGPSIETPYGGDGVPYSCVLNLRFRRKGDLEVTQNGKKSVVGLETIIQVMKNHVSHKMPISSVFTVASGMIPPTKEAFEAFKKKHLK